MIGKYSLLGIEGKDLVIDDILGNVVTVIDDYRGRFGISLVKSLVKNDNISNFILHDFHGYYKIAGEGVLRVYAGVDIKFPDLSNGDIDYFLIFTELLRSLLLTYNFKEGRWVFVLGRGLEDAIRRSDGTFKSMIMELQTLKSESSGLEKELYTEIINIFRSIFTYDDIEHLNGEFEDSLYSKLSGKVIIDYTRIKNHIGRHLIMALYHFDIMFNNPREYQVLPYSDYLLSSIIVYNHFLAHDVKNGIFFLGSFDKKIYGFTDILIVSNKNMASYIKTLSYLPLEAIDSSYTVVDRYGIGFLKVPYEKFETNIQTLSFEDLGANYLVKYKEEIRRIMEHILNNGRSSIDGLIIATGLERRLVYSLVERLWRDGYIKRSTERAGVFYRISVKGMKFLKSG